VSGRSEAVAGIMAAIAAYAQALDDGRTEAVVATFCDDGSVDIPGQQTVGGRDALLEEFARLKPTAPQRHTVVNTLVTAADDDHAEAQSDLVFFRRGDAGWAVALVGRYRDTFRCVDGTWRFSHRTLTFVQ